MILIDKLKKDYSEGDAVPSALRGVSFRIEKGEFISIIGPSGSGKSTLLHILSFLDRPTGGTYTFFGKSIDDMSDQELARVRNEEMGFVFQAFNLLSRLTVYENVEIPLLYSTLAPAHRKEAIEHAVNSVGLSEKLNVQTAKLSGGQKQRVAIARALVQSPAAILSDEPIASLDPALGEQIVRLLCSLARERNIALLCSLHQIELARRHFDRVVELVGGRVQYDGVTDRRALFGPTA